MSTPATEPVPDARPALAMTFEETRTRMRVGRSTLFRIVAAGDLPSVKIGRSRRFLVEDVDQFLRDRREAS